MSIEFKCKHCGCKLIVQDGTAGQNTHCRHCFRPLVVPSMPATLRRLPGDRPKPATADDSEK